MKRLNKKVLIVALFAMLVMCVTAAILSFSLAGSGSSISGEAVADAETPSGKTNIDYIIENSNSTDSEVDTVYHIVEIGSSNTPSTIKTIVDDLRFRYLVFDGNRTIEQVMAEGKIDYKFYGTPSLIGDSTAISNAASAIANADFVYVSNDPYNQFSASNDIPEDIKLELSSAAVADYKPFIIDSPTATEEIKNSTIKTFTGLADKVFSVYGNSRYTFSWKTGVTSEDFLGRTDSSSNYLPIHGDTTGSTWENVARSDGTNVTIAKILTISNGSTDNALTTELMKDNTELYPVATSGDAETIAAFANVYKLNPDSSLYRYGYKSNEVKPDYIKTDVIDINDSAQKALLATTDLSQYDIVVVESGCKGQSMTDEAYNAFSASVYGLKHILYSNEILSGSSSSSGIIKSDAVNYQYVVEKTMGSTETAISTNILVSNKEKIDSYLRASIPDSFIDIVKIINNGSFRGIGGPEASSNYYTVLEVQPCYPIDTILADKFSVVKSTFAGFSKREQMDNTDPGFYYLRTDGVLNGLTADEISFDGTNSISEIEATGDYSTISTSNANKLQDYYSWQISRAKIAHATGLPYDQVRVVHMSSSEFACSKDSLLDNYDFIYIGGDNSSIKSISHFLKYGTTSNTPVYNMYYHNGDYYQYASSLYGSDGYNTFGELVGNDITAEKLDELKEYITKGMPVVFGSDVSAAYDLITDENKYTLTNIDPDSNMYKLLKYAKTAYDNDLTNVLWNFNINDTIKVANDASALGTTYNGYATVYGGIETEDYLGQAVTSPSGSVNEVQLSLLLRNANERPKLALTLKPVTFKEADPSTAVTEKTLKFNYEITGNADATYIMNIYVDDDGNSRFTEDEIVASSSGFGIGSLSADLADDFFGPVYWKFEVIDKATNSSASSKGVTKIKRSATDPKDLVNLLQIMPSNDKENITGSGGKGTLWFCTECQQSKLFLKGNRYYQGKYELAAAQGIGFNDSVDNAWGQKISTTTYPLPNISSYDTEYTYPGNSLGVHEHNFGIVKYDANLKVGSVTGIDDWTTNWADTLADDYDFNTTIITTRQYETMCANIAAEYSGKTADEISTISSDYLNSAAEFKSLYETMNSMINGDYDNVDDEDKVVFENYMKNTLGVTDTVLEEFKTSQTDLDDYIDQIYADMTSKGYTYFDKTNYEQAKNELKYEQKYHTYYDFYSLYNSQDNFTDKNRALLRNSSGGMRYTDYFVIWRNAKIYEQYFKQKYMENLELGSVNETGKVDLSNVFSIIVLGAAENFGNDDITTTTALDALKTYMDNEGNVLFFHDTLNQDESSGKKLTDAFRSYFGQDARHLTTSGTNSGGVTKYKSVVETGYDASKYYMSDVDSTWAKFSSTGLTSRSSLGDTVSGTNAGGYMHKYSVYFPSNSEGVPVQDAQFNYASFAASGSQIATNRASQNNDGIVTIYPFTIDSKLMISATHVQAFALDTEDPEMTVWYSLAGGSNGTQSSPYVSDPNNGTENYFIYTYKNITYCGAGHSLLTGIAKNNNDERRLFINIICNSVRRTAIGTSIKVYDYDSTDNEKTNDKVMMDIEGKYYMKVDDTTSAPNFSYVATTDTSSKVQVANVKIYYDLDYEDGKTSAYENNDNHVLIFNKDYPTDDTIGSGMLKKIDSTVAEGKTTINGITTTNLNLKPEYFAPYNSEYTYIVVAVTDTTGKTVYKRIKIKTKPYLFDLT